MAKKRQMTSGRTHAQHMDKCERQIKKEKKHESITVEK